MITIPAVSNYGIRKAVIPKVSVNFDRCPASFLFLVIRCTYSRRANWISINQNPLIADNVIVRRGFFRISSEHFVLGARKASFVDHVEGLIERTLREARQLFVDILTARFEIAADGWFGINAANLNDIFRIMQQGDGIFDQYSVHEFSASLSFCVMKSSQ